MKRRLFYFGYGLLAYVLFLGVFVYAIGFIGNFLAPTALDAEPTAPFGKALLINTLLLGLFAAQHSVMARPGFKAMWTKIIPKEIERNTYVLATNLCMIAMFIFWEPMGGTIWNVENTIGRAALYSLYAAGWGLVFVATFMINHFDLFGLRQSWFALKGEEYKPIPFGTPGLYKYVRHPLYVGWFTVFWATPTMTTAHLVFAIATSAYILIAIQFEERDLVAHFGEKYAMYRKETPMFIPRFARRGDLKPIPVLEDNKTA